MEDPAFNNGPGLPHTRPIAFGQPWNPAAEAEKLVPVHQQAPVRTINCCGRSRGRGCVIGTAVAAGLLLLALLGGGIAAGVVLGTKTNNSSPPPPVPPPPPPPPVDISDCCPDGANAYVCGSTLSQTPGCSGLVDQTSVVDDDLYYCLASSIAFTNVSCKDGCTPSPSSGTPAGCHLAQTVFESNVNASLGTNADDLAGSTGSGGPCCYPGYLNCGSRLQPSRLAGGAADECAWNLDPGTFDKTLFQCTCTSTSCIATVETNCGYGSCVLEGSTSNDSCSRPTDVISYQT